jgi:hypothetical protein
MAIYSKGERVCVNAPVQGGAADYMKIAMVRVKKAIKANGWGQQVKLVMNNHDALTFEVDNALNPADVRAALLPAVEYSVANFPKIVSEWSFGKRWGSMVDIHPDTVIVPTDNEIGWMVKGISQPAVEEDDDDFALDGPTNEHGFSTAGPAGDDDFPTAPKSTTTVVGAGIGTLAVAHTTTATLPAPPPQPEGPPKELIVEIEEMPSAGQYQAFLHLCNERAGQDTLTLKTPQGDLELPLKVSLSPTDQPEISMYLGGARVYYPIQSVDTESLSSGLTF